MLAVRICTISRVWGEAMDYVLFAVLLLFSPPSLQSVSNHVHALFSYHLIPEKYTYIYKYILYLTYQVLLVIEILFYV